MTTTPERKAAAAQPRPNMRIGSYTMPQGPQLRKSKPVFHRPDAETPQNARKNYERYLALARAEAQGGDRIAAENYFQHAEHYLRSMHDSRATGHSAGKS
jgi:hypothetical protein